LAFSSFIEAVKMLPKPNPALGPNSTDFSTPHSLKVLDIDDLIPAVRNRPVSGSLVDVLAKRRSVRSYGALTARELVQLLDVVFALQRSAPADDGGTRRFRPIPSAGGRHPLAPVVLIENVKRLEPGLWRLDSDARQLHLVANNPNILRRAWRALCDAGAFEIRPPAIIVLAAKFDATLARYPEGSALVWRDAGVALATLHLASTDLGLASCILGTAGVLDGDLLEACGVTGNLIGDVGALAVGGSSGP
jgi:SagB-type dehydrogenase family enzyme